MTKIIMKGRSQGKTMIPAGATIVPNAATTIPLLTRKGFHAYFAKRLAGYVCDDQAFIDWRGLRLPVCLRTGASAVRRAFPIAQL